MDTYSLLPENEYTEVEGRRYLVPTLGVSQTNDFINNLRANQQTQNAQITQQTQNLGTKIPSNMGGLTGGTGYWTSRYQTPQTNSALQSLRTAAQADALKTALANEKARMQKQYQDAYRAQQKSAYDKSQAANSAIPNANNAASLLGYDVNGGGIGGTVSLPSNVQPGEFIPVTSSSGYYLSSDGSNWWQLANPTNWEQTAYLGMIPMAGSYRSGARNAQNGQTYTFNGKTFMFLQNDSFPDGRWFRARQVGTY